MIYLFFLLNLLVLNNCQNYLGKISDWDKATSKFSKCVSSLSDVLCYVVTDNYEAEPETNDIIMKSNVKYSITSYMGRYKLTLDIRVVNVVGNCTFNALNVCSYFYLFNFITVNAEK
jgi:hypothetical protein